TVCLKHLRLVCSRDAQRGSPKHIVQHRDVRVESPHKRRGGSSNCISFDLFFNSLFLCFFFFFQAEDGIRDLIVTGVQTCALPISSAAPSARGCRRGCATSWTRSSNAWPRTQRAARQRRSAADWTLSRAAGPTGW